MNDRYMIVRRFVNILTGYAGTTDWWQYYKTLSSLLVRKNKLERLSFLNTLFLVQYFRVRSLYPLR